MKKQLLCLGVFLLFLVGAMSVNANLPKQEVTFLGNVTAEDWEENAGLLSIQKYAPHVINSYGLSLNNENKVVDISQYTTLADDEHFWDRYNWTQIDRSVSADNGDYWEGYTTDNLTPETRVLETILDITQDTKVIVAESSLGVSAALEGKQRYNRFGAWIMADVSVSDPDPSPVPEPATMLLLGAGLVIGTGFIRKNR